MTNYYDGRFNTPEDMNCPVTCSRCDEWMELAESNFNTPFCRCRDMASPSCNHGICDECLKKVEAIPS